MNTQALHNAKELVAREKLDFGLDENIPRWWFDNNPYKTRLVDALQATFPDGERYFISCVRAFRDQITDPTMQAEVKTFIRQEGQHGLVHSQYNQLLREQGMDIDSIVKLIKRFDAFYTKTSSKEYNLALTAAFEHFTAMLAEIFFVDKRSLANVDPKMRAMMAWHAVEEMEHKAVAFDVMQKVAKVGYFKRCLAMVHVTVFLSVLTIYFTNRLLKNDGFSFGQRMWMTAKCRWWLFGYKGMISRHAGSLFAYFRPDFHPWQQKAIHNYDAWVEAYSRTGDPLLAGDALYKAAH
jgi:predicted metal-dependent hydrolase